MTLPGPATPTDPPPSARGLMAPWSPSPGDPWDLPKTGHLLRRAAFSGSLAERRRLVRLGHERALDEVLRPAVPAIEPREGGVAPDQLGRVRAAWFRRWLDAPERLAVRMAWFWHHHFPTGNQAVRDAGAMAGQMRTFARLGLGRFDDLLLAVCRDPAMLVWLDGARNTAGRPNENFAREFFELFTLGRGHYTERDVREAARAFTGWRVVDGRVVFGEARHDRGEKTVLGHTGPFRDEDVVRITAAHPASAPWLSRRLLESFVHPEPDDEEVLALAQVYTASDRDIGRTLGVLLRSRLFFSPRAWRRRIRGPAEFTVGLVRSLGAEARPADLATAAAAMGERVFEPETVEGWRGGEDGLDPVAWLARSNFAADLFSGARGHLRPPPHHILRRLGDPAHRADFALELLHDGVVPDEARERIHALAAGVARSEPGGASTLLHAAALLPEVHLA